MQQKTVKINKIKLYRKQYRRLQCIIKWNNMLKTMYFWIHWIKTNYQPTNPPKKEWRHQQPRANNNPNNRQCQSSQQFKPSTNSEMWLLQLRILKCPRDRWHHNYCPNCSTKSSANKWWTWCRTNNNNQLIVHSSRSHKHWWNSSKRIRIRWLNNKHKELKSQQLVQHSKHNKHYPKSRTYKFKHQVKGQKHNQRIKLNRRNQKNNNRRSRLRLLNKHHQMDNLCNLHSSIRCNTRCTPWQHHSSSKPSINRWWCSSPSCYLKTLAKLKVWAKQPTVLSLFLTTRVCNHQCSSVYKHLQPTNHQCKVHSP